MAAFIGGVGVPLPALGALGGAAPVGPGGVPLTFENLYRKVENWTPKGFWTRNWNAQKKFQQIAYDALNLIHAHGGVPPGTDLDHFRKVFKEVATHMKRDGDAKSIQQCETEYQTLKVAVESLENMRKTYTNNRMQFKERLPAAAGGVFVKSDALKAIDEAIEERKEELNKLGWEVIQSVAFGVGDVSYETVPKIRALYERTRGLYYKINGTPAGAGVAARPGLIQKLTALENTTTQAAIRRERLETSYRRMVADNVLSKKSIAGAIGFVTPDLIDIAGNRLGMAVDVKSMAIRLTCAVISQAALFLLTEDF